MSRTTEILIIDDEPDIREVIGFALTRAGLDFVEAGDADEAAKVISTRPPDLILLDWMLPGLSGIDFARRLRRSSATRNIPIIFLTARGEESDKIWGLDAGGDDYVSKPFSSKELVARIRAVLRRSEPKADGPLEIAGLRVDPASHRVTVLERSLALGPTEFNLLHFFMTHQERVFSRPQLIELVWGDGTYVEDRTVDVHIRRLRKALEPSGHDHLIQTVRSAGYRFSVQD